MGIASALLGPCHPGTCALAIKFAAWVTNGREKEGAPHLWLREHVHVCLRVCESLVPVQGVPPSLYSPREDRGVGYKKG